MSSTRRTFLTSSALLFAGSSLSASRKDLTLSIGTYSLKGIPLEKGIELVASIGYDGIEIATQPGFDGEPAKLSPERRREVRRRLSDSNLKVTALMEHLSPSSNDVENAGQLDRLGKVADLSSELAMDSSHPPLIQTVLGSGTWEEKKSLFRDRVGTWLDATRSRKVVLAIKPHRGGAMSRPDEGVWLIKQLGERRWLRLVYDYSHYAFRGMTLEETLRVALPHTAYVAVKDATRAGEKVIFDLPGVTGNLDYTRLIKLLVVGGYHGDVCCEVSSMVSSKPGYDPVSAAKTCYANMNKAFEMASLGQADD